MRISAHHAHVFPPAMKSDATIDTLLRLMDDCGIEQAVCFAPFPHACQDALAPNDWLAAELKSQPRLCGFGTVDVRRQDLRDQVRHIADLGLRGVKFHPNAQEFGILDPCAHEVYAVAQDLDLFITFHCGVHASPLLKTRPILFDEVAWQYPRLRFSLEHVGGYHFFAETLAVLFNHLPPPWEPDKRCNVFAGLSSCFCPEVNRFWYLGPERLRELVAQVGADYIIYGMDFPYYRQREVNVGLQAVRDLGLSQEDQAKILGGNLRRELRLP